jgi:hypothetical protein
MNVKFADKLSATCWHNMTQEPGGEDLDRWLLRFFHGGWCDRDDDFPQDALCAVGDEDLWCRQSGYMATLHVGVATRDVCRKPAGRASANGTLTTNEFSWAVTSHPVDVYGMSPDASKLEGRMTLMVGGLIYRDQQWSSHT